MDNKKNEVEVKFYMRGTLVGSKIFTVGNDDMIPLPADALFAFKESEIRIKAIIKESPIEQAPGNNEAH